MNNIGSVLGTIRKEKGLTRKEVSNKLHDFGIDISDKTLYGYECGRTTANADMFLALCKIYGITDIFSTFGYDGYNEDGSLSLNMYEVDMVEKYRTLDTYGKDAVDSVLTIEYERCRIKEEPSSYIPDNIRPIDYYMKNASAGSGQVVFDDTVVERITIPDIPKYKRVAYAIGVNGNSMEPLYHDGDMLLIEPTVDMGIGEIGIFIVDGDAYVKKLGNGELISLNKDYSNIPLTEYTSCMGRVVDNLSQK